jgi:hypothetical protein
MIPWKRKRQLTVYLLKEKKKKCAAFVHTQAKETWSSSFIKEQ